MSNIQVARSKLKGAQAELAGLEIDINYLRRANLAAKDSRGLNELILKQEKLIKERVFYIKYLEDYLKENDYPLIERLLEPLFTVYYFFKNLWKR